MRHPTRSLTAALCLAALAAGTGCRATIAYIVASTARPPKVPAVFSPPKGKTIAVFVDDPADVIGYEPARRKLIEELNHLLRDHGVAGRTVAYEAMQAALAGAARASDPTFSVSEIGQVCGADLVLYLEVTEFRLKDAPSLPIWNGTFAARARLVEVGVGRLWPKDRAQGYPVPPVKEPARHEASETHGRTLAVVLAEKMARNVAQLFYKHEAGQDAREGAGSG